MVWFNPPFNAQVKTKIGQEFFRILESHFPETHELHAHINKQTVKLSYSCTRNMEATIASHNKKILSKKKADDRDCNCRKKTECPLSGKCCTKCVIYKAEIEDNGRTKNYIGCTEGEFKTRYNNHKDSFRNSRKKSSTALASLVWEGGHNPNPSVKWTIVEKTNKYKPGDKTCDLCLSEKLCIMKHSKSKDNINKRSEIASICVHRNKYKLANANFE